MLDVVQIVVDCGGLEDRISDGLSQVVEDVALEQLLITSAAAISSRTMPKSIFFILPS
jgi:hypothetical protein